MATKMTRPDGHVRIGRRRRAGRIAAEVPDERKIRRLEEPATAMVSDVILCSFSRLRHHQALAGRAARIRATVGRGRRAHLPVQRRGAARGS